MVRLKDVDITNFKEVIMPDFFLWLKMYVFLTTGISAKVLGTILDVNEKFAKNSVLMDHFDQNPAVLDWFSSMLLF